MSRISAVAAVALGIRLSWLREHGILDDEERIVFV